MSEEKEGLETQEKLEIDGDPESVAGETDQQEALEDDGLEAELAGEEEEDDKGVPLKNRLKELERKLEREKRQNELYQQTLAQLTKPKPKEKEDSEPDFKELAAAEIAEKMGTTPEVVQAIIELTENRIDRRLHETDKQRREVEEWEKQKASKRWEALQDFNEKFCDDDDRIFTEITTDGGSTRRVWNENSKLLAKAREVLKREPELSKREGGEVLALMRAKVELMKGGKKVNKPTDVDRAQTMLGKGGRRGGSTGGLKRDGKYYRTLSDAEYDTLPRAEKDEYDKWEVLQRFKKDGQD